MAILIRNLRLTPFEEEAQLFEKAACKAGVPQDAFKNLRIVRCSLDARKKNDIHFLYTVRAELEEEAKAKAPKEETKEEVPGVAQIGIEDFAKVELRAAKITACEPIPKAKKLLKLTLDDGTGTPRTVASGIAPWYQPEDLTGKTIVVVANLKPAKLCGVESNGMILAADCPGGQVKVLFLDDSIPAGSKIR